MADVTPDFSTILQAAQSHAMRLGVFDTTARHEPKTAPNHGITYAMWLQSVRPVQRRSGLTATSVRVQLMGRIYQNMLAEPQDDTDPNMLRALFKLMGAYTGNFTLAGRIAQVDLLGAHGPALEAQAGFLEHDRKMFRIIDVTLPLILDDVWTQGA